MSKKLYQVVTVIREFCTVEADSPEAACELVCQRDKPDEVEVVSRDAIESVSLDPIVRRD